MGLQTCRSCGENSIHAARSQIQLEADLISLDPLAICRPLLDLILLTLLSRLVSRGMPTMLLDLKPTGFEAAMALVVIEISITVRKVATFKALLCEHKHYTMPKHLAIRTIVSTKH